MEVFYPSLLSLLSFPLPSTSPPLLLVNCRLKIAPVVAMILRKFTTDTSTWSIANTQYITLYVNHNTQSVVQWHTKVSVQLWLERRRRRVKDNASVVLQGDSQLELYSLWLYATRMHSADYAVARCLSVRLSVRPSVCHTPVLRLKNYTYPHFFSPSGSHTILLFPCQTGCQYSDGNPPNEGVECKEYEKIMIFDQYRALSRNWCKIEP